LIGQTLTLPDTVARDAAWIDTDLIENGDRINAMDIRIAATARANDMVLIAPDARFNRAPDLNVHNPREEIGQQF